MKKHLLLIAIIGATLTTSCQMLNSGQTTNGSPNNAKPAANENKPVNKAGNNDSKAGAVSSVFDGRKEIETEEAKVSPAELNLVKAEVKKREAEIKKQVKMSCDDGEEVTIVSSVSGSFTKAGAQQKLYLYELCRAGRSFGIGGIVVAEGDAVVAHQAYGENGLEGAAEALSDVNMNGLSEVLLVGTGTGQGYTEGGISIFEFKNGNFDYWGGASVYSDNSGAAEDDTKIKTTASNITVETGADPVFYEETYEQKGGNNTWNSVKKKEKLTLNKKEAPKWVKIM